MKKLFARFFAWLHRLHCEDNGNPSSARAVMLLWHVAVIVVWVVVSFMHMQMADVNAGVLAVLALVGGQKVIQKFGEQKPPSADTSVDTPPGA